MSKQKKRIRGDLEYSPITRRAVLLGAVGMAGISVLAGRLYYLQFMRSDKYHNMSEGNRIKLKVIPPVRGKILDRNGLALAENTSVFRLFIQLDKHPNISETVKKLQQWITFSEEEIEAARKKSKRRRYGLSFLVKDGVPWEEVVKIEHHIPELPGISIEQGQQRIYPLAEPAAHTIGYVGFVNDEEQKSFYRWPQAKIGRQGMEQKLENDLRGEAGLKQMEVNVRGLTIRELEDKPPISGKDLTTSLDRELQDFTYRTLLEKISGSAVIMDAQTGAIHAIGSAPSFNSTVMSQGIGTKAWNELRDSEAYPLLNKAIAGQYPPGSTFKMVTGLAGLTSGVINPNQRIYCPGHFFMGRRRFNCWKAGGHGSVNLKAAMAQSCDTYFYTIGRECGIEHLAETGRKFGLGSRTGIDIPNEKGGNMPDPAWKRKSYNQAWQGGDTINASIGQGYVLTTPVQLATLTAALVNGGKLLRPSILQASSHKPIDIDPKWLSVITQSMSEVVNGNRGTARGSRINELDYLMGGKTGTAQVVRIKKRGQDQSKLPWNQRHHALFVGYAPIEKPRYVCSVIIEHGGGGSAVAAPIAKQLLLKTKELLG